ncbi:hypothetical protein CEXT_481951 [Caerostris extrusa]|uniref:Uncharacterized protein n=1 Tax=Caerostris extrusa TaxID=172846 RepID=A0AAV4UF65_CAEEX|nr:hypothetical protein CEXT_481951 [Caerostris extrusa]
MESTRASIDGFESGIKPHFVVLHCKQCIVISIGRLKKDIKRVLISCSAQLKAMFGTCQQQKDGSRLLRINLFTEESTIPNSFLRYNSGAYTRDPSILTGASVFQRVSPLYDPRKQERFSPRNVSEKHEKENSGIVNKSRSPRDHKIRSRNQTKWEFTRMLLAEISLDGEAASLLDAVYASFASFLIRVDSSRFRDISLLRRTVFLPAIPPGGITSGGSLPAILRNNVPPPFNPRWAINYKAHPVNRRTPLQHVTIGKETSSAEEYRSTE